LSFTGTVSWTFAEQNTTTTTYTANVTLSPKSEYVFTSSLANAANIRDLLGADSVNYAAFNENDPDVVTDDTITFTATFIKTDPTTDDTAEETNQNTNNTASSSGTTGTTGSSGSSDTASASSGSTGSTSSDTTSSDSSSSTDSSSSVSEPSDDVTAFSISPSDSMQVAITVDELDVLSIETGQEAIITLDAVEGEFTGSVAKISDTATTSGGVVSYDVDISVPKDESMKTGMSASATITIAKSEDIVTLPADAIQEMGDRIFVYTEMDEETNELSGEVEVETGLSDGSKVEITSGLSDGDTVYYIVLTASESSDSESTEESSGMMMEMQGGGDMGGGSAPEGGTRPGGSE
jgi:HlyD family secretion protein